MRLLLHEARRLEPELCQSLDLKVHDVQFQLCELDKYERVGAGGRGACTVLPYKPLSTTTLADQTPSCRPAMRPLELEWHYSRINSAEYSERVPSVAAFTEECAKIISL